MRPSAVSAMRREVWLLPLPVRTAPTAITGLRALELRVARAEHREGGPGGLGNRADAHHVRVGHVTVGEDALVHVQLADQLRQVLLDVDGDAFGIARPGQAAG